ncbi:hypothetical protein QM012_004417 [Aureobasidium pullulans]|uniref:Uncharacterized protein n=1 Tax=Aureobasidium pullulans TaxID=5580 RepID=A0ABR0TT09_AURPU
MSQSSQVYELPGDLPPVAELPDESLPAELSGEEVSQEDNVSDSRRPPAGLMPARYSNDLLPTPFSAFSTISSNPSLKPSPLNFSRPNFSRPRPVEATSYNFGSRAGPIPEYDPDNRPTLSEPVQAHQDEKKTIDGEENDNGVDNPAPSFGTYILDVPRHSVDGASIGGASIDEAVPPPIRTYADLKDIQVPRDSIDEATPPAIQASKGYRGFNHDFSTLNISRGDSIYEDFPTPPGTKSPKEQFRKDSQALPHSVRENVNDATLPSSGQSTHPLARMNTTSSMASSFDEAAPPPVSTRRHQLSHMDTESSKGTKSSIQTKGSRVDSVVDPSPGVPPRSVARKEPSAEPCAPNVLIYKPYLDYASSKGSDSIRSITTRDESSSTSAVDSDRRYSSTGSETSSVADFAFDGQLGWNPRNYVASGKEANRQQRWSAPLTNPLKIVTSRSKGKEKQQTPMPTMQEQTSRHGSNASSQNTLSPASSRTSTGTGSSASSRAPTIPERVPRIIKRTSIDQMSEHVNPWQGETMSDRGSVSSNEWTSSEVDTSGLSVEKIHKLKKKGINPALYVEMQNARKGKNKWVSPLQGNSFIS